MKKKSEKPSKEKKVMPESKPESKEPKEPKEPKLVNFFGEVVDMSEPGWSYSLDYK